MIWSRQEGRPEEALIREAQAAHERDFAAFHIEFDNYGSTNSQENEVLCREFWQALSEKSLVAERDVPFFVEDGQPVGKLVYEPLSGPVDRLYGEAGSSYQGQGLKLSKHFAPWV
jgi:hypothetical protein